MDNLPSTKIKDIRGERFGRLLVTSFSRIADNLGRNAYWSCLCDCGNTSVVSSGSLRSKTTVSCGCYAKEVSSYLIKKAHTRGDHLYFIQCGDYIKIGRANNIKKRLAQLQSMNPYDLVLIDVIENAGEREHEVHEKLKLYHHRGEWFKLDPGEVVSIGSVSDG